MDSIVVLTAGQFAHDKTKASAAVMAADAFCFAGRKAVIALP
jgi:hypothetical protein